MRATHRERNISSGLRVAMLADFEALLKNCKVRLEGSELAGIGGGQLTTWSGDPSRLHGKKDRLKTRLGYC
jgi:hypothetical protein